MTLRLKFWAFGALAALVLVGDYSGAIAKEKSVCEALKAIDSDNDGTVDLNEAKNAASALFDKLETDKDGTLTTKELQGRLSRNEFEAADPDKDATLSKDEYLAIVERLFKKADVNNDGTLDAKELKSKAGRALKRLID